MTVDARHGDAAADAHGDVAVDARTDAPPPDSAADTHRADSRADTAATDSARDSRPDRAADGGSDASPFTVTVTPAPAWLRQGGTEPLTVTLSHATDAAVPVTATGLPAGVTAPKVNILAGSSGGTLSLSATADAGLGVASPIVIAGHAQEPITLVVAGASGSLDPTFNQSGVWNLPPAGGDSTATARSIAVLADGDIVLGGSLSSSTTTGWGVLCLNPDGTPNATFTTNLASSGLGALLPTTGSLTAVAAVPGTSKTVIAGTYVDNAETDLGLLMLNPDGSRDESFGTDGLATVDHQQVDLETVTGLAVAPNGDIAAVGATEGGTAYLVTLTGTHNGVVAATWSFPANPALSSVVFLPDGSLAVGGNGASSPQQLYVAYVTSSTTLTVASEGTYGATGMGAALLTATGMACDPAGDVFLAGNGVETGGMSTQNAVTVLSSAEAILTPAPYGVAFPGPAMENNSGYTAVASDQDGQAVVVGSGHDIDGYSGYVARLLSTGSLDTSFATSGVEIISAVSTTQVVSFNAVAFDSIGRILVAGNYGAGFYVARMWP